MDIDAARFTIRNAFRISGDLQALLPFLKRRCDADEYKEYATAIAHAIDLVNVALLNRTIKVFPELEREIEERISGHGRYI